jgi:hypothetical protein
MRSFMGRHRQGRPGGARERDIARAIGVARSRNIEAESRALALTRVIR